jgi:hypothetical protein
MAAGPSMTRRKGTRAMTRSGPTVAFGADFGFHEAFLVPCDLSSDSEVARGSFLRVPALGPEFRESGIIFPDGTEQGRNSINDEAKAPTLRTSYAVGKRADTRKAPVGPDRLAG